VEDETSIAARSTSVFEPTGAPVATYSSTTRTRISFWRGVSTGSGPGVMRSIVVICRDFSEKINRHATSEKTAAAREEQAVALSLDEPEPLQPGKRLEIECSLDVRERKRVVEAQPEHEALLRLRGRGQRLQLPWQGFARSAPP